LFFFVVVGFNLPTLESFEIGIAKILQRLLNFVDDIFVDFEININ